MAFQDVERSPFFSFVLIFLSALDAFASALSVRTFKLICA